MHSSTIGQLLIEDQQKPGQRCNQCWQGKSSFHRQRVGGCTNIPFMPSGGKQVLFFQLFMIKRRIGFKMDPARSMDDGNGWQGDMISIQMGAAACQNTPSHFDTYIFNIL
jgi:hypothetical protein